MDTETEMVIPADFAHVAFVRSVVSASADLVPTFSEDRIYDLTLVLTEAVTNAIRAHHEIGITMPVRVGCQVVDDTVTLVVKDKGPGFNPDSLPAMPPLDSLGRLHHESGRGVELMELLADETAIRSGPDGTEVRLVMRADA